MTSQNIFYIDFYECPECVCSIEMKINNNVTECGTKIHHCHRIAYRKEYVLNTSFSCSNEWISVDWIMPTANSQQLKTFKQKEKKQRRNNSEEFYIRLQFNETLPQWPFKKNENDVMSGESINVSTEVRLVRINVALK